VSVRKAHFLFRELGFFTLRYGARTFSSAWSWGHSRTRMSALRRHGLAGSGAHLPQKLPPRPLGGYEPAFESLAIANRNESLHQHGSVESLRLAVSVSVKIEAWILRNVDDGQRLP